MSVHFGGGGTPENHPTNRARQTFRAQARQSVQLSHWHKRKYGCFSVKFFTAAHCQAPLSPTSTHSLHIAHIDMSSHVFTNHQQLPMRSPSLLAACMWILQGFGLRNIMKGSLGRAAGNSL